MTYNGIVFHHVSWNSIDWFKGWKDTHKHTHRLPCYDAVLLSFLKKRKYVKKWFLYIIKSLTVQEVSTWSSEHIHYESWVLDRLLLAAFSPFSTVQYLSSFAIIFGLMSELSHPRIRTVKNCGSYTKMVSDFVNTVMEVRVAWVLGNFLTARETIRSSRRLYTELQR